MNRLFKPEQVVMKSELGYMYCSAQTTDVLSVYQIHIILSSSYLL